MERNSGSGIEDVWKPKSGDALPMCSMTCAHLASVRRVLVRAVKTMREDELKQIYVQKIQNIEAEQKYRKDYGVSFARTKWEKQ